MVSSDVARSRMLAAAEQHPSIHLARRSLLLRVRRSRSRAALQISSPQPTAHVGRDDVLALDVEYVHLAPTQQRRLGRGRVRILPAEVCLAAPGGAITFHSFCRPGEAALAGVRHAGGVSESFWRDAPLLADVMEQVQAAIAGRLVVGHGLGKDLATLGIKHPRELQVDTVAWRDFQGPGGQARPLAALVEQQLGRSIQTGTCHSARLDALAVLELYLRFVAGDTAHMDEESLQQHELEQILAHAQQSGLGEM